jgi:GNAT superfamily N-acetyltransferase
MNEAKLVGYTPGALGRIIELHGTYYAKHWGLGLYFEAKVAAEMAEFLSRFDAEQDGAWFAQIGGKIAGGIVIAGSQADPEEARLRWFIVDPAYQGLGLGSQLMDAAMSFLPPKTLPARLPDDIRRLDRSAPSLRKARIQIMWGKRRQPSDRQSFPHRANFRIHPTRRFEVDRS